MKGLVLAAVLIGVSLLIGYIFDRMARAARLRRDKRYDWYTALLLTATGAITGWLDGGGPGAAIGAIIGFFGGTLIASIVYGTLSVIWTLIRGPLPKRGQEAGSVSMLHRLGILIAGGLPVVFAVIIAHETYWMFNLVSLTAQNDVSSKVALAAGAGQPREMLKENITNRRWHVAASTWRPARWVLQPELLAAARGELAFLDMIELKKPPDSKPEGWTDIGDGEIVWTTWNMPAFEDSFLPDTTVNKVATRISQDRITFYTETVEHTWVLRHIPAQWFIRVPAAGD